MLAYGIALVMVAFDGDRRDSGLLEEFKAGYGMIHRLRVYVAAVEEISRNEHEINFVRDGVIRYHLVPRPEKIFRALFQIITAATQMYVCQMEESHMTSIIRQETQKSE
jgi:hypothetical protein